MDNSTDDRVRSGEPTVHDLMVSDPESVVLWLQRTWPEAAPKPSGLDWTSLSSGCISLAQTALMDGRHSDAVLWGTVAVGILERLGENHEQNERFLHSAMSLRSNLIHGVGPDPGNPILDPSVVISWFQSRVRQTPEEARVWAGAIHVPGSPNEDVAKKRSLANMVAVLEGLAGRPDVSLPPELLQWLALDRVLKTWGTAPGE